MVRSRPGAAFAALFVCASLGSAPLAAQGPFVAPVLSSAPVAPLVDTRLRVFVDCPSGGCDQGYLITELPFALFTTDRADADVHLLITRMGTASGGGEYTYTFIGLRRFAARTDTLVSFVEPNATDDLRRREIARIAKIGLAPYAMRLPGADRISLRYDAPPASTARPSTGVLGDKWDSWVFRLRGDASGNSESRSSNYQVNSGVNASRMTEAWKVSFNAQGQYRANTFKFSDGTEANYILRGADASARIVRSVDEHWSVGARAATGFSEFSNFQSSGSFDLSAEYNVYAWSEATSRQLIVLAAVGGRYYDYDERTIYGLTAETRPIARVVIASESRQAWGSVDAQLRFGMYLHDTRAYSVSFSGRTSLRITRGLSLDLRGDAAKVNDQLYLPRGDATDDEVLTRQRALATNYRLSGSVGLTFTFGSIFNTIVNPRLDDLGG